jgi:hypothetical protein
MTESKQNIDFSRMAAEWPSEILSRNKVGEFTGGMIDGRTMANFDSNGEGIEDRFYIGNKTGYFVKSFIKWLESRAKTNFEAPKRKGKGME